MQSALAAAADNAAASADRTADTMKKLLEAYGILQDFISHLYA